MTSEKKHVEFGPSALHRRLACPASARLERGLADHGSIHAATGSCVHTVIEICWREQIPAADLIGLEYDGILVTEEMAASAQLCLDFYSSITNADDIIWCEVPVDLGAFNPPAIIKGTADFIRYRPQGQLCTVVDYKNGVGYVDAVGNPQGRAYALGACAKLAEMGYIVSEVEIVIVQPNGPGNAIRSERIGALELAEWANELFDGVSKALEPDAPAIPGDQCKYCKAKTTCPGLSHLALDVAHIGPTVTVPPNPDDIAPEKLAWILNNAKIAREFLDACEARAEELLGKGASVPGWKLVQKRGVRKWRDDDATAKALLGLGGIGEDDIFTRKLITPAQAEKLLGKSNAGVLTDLVIAESSGTTLAPEADKRPAITGGAAAHFTALE